MRNLVCACVAYALWIGSAHAGVAPRPTPVVITLDGRDYVTFVAPVVYSPHTRLLLAPESSLVNCRRIGDLPLPIGPIQLQHTLANDKVDAVAMRIEFHPTRIFLDTVSGDVRCDGLAAGGVTGVGRVFHDEFEPDLLPSG